MRAPSQVAQCSFTIESHPTMRKVLESIVTALTGDTPPESRNRFQLTRQLIELLAGPDWLLVIDEAQRLNSKCIEVIRTLHDHISTRFSLLLVGGDGCWEVLSKEPMLRSRITRRVPFQPLSRLIIPTLIGGYHPI